MMPVESLTHRFARLGSGSLDRGGYVWLGNRLHGDVQACGGDGGVSSNPL
jgi:hypothetical protein